MSSDEMSEEEQKQLEAVEDEFRMTYDKHIATIKRLNKEASEAVKRLTDFLDQTGIPFSCTVSDITQQYTPPTFRENFQGLDDEIVHEIIGSWSSFVAGWAHSDFC